MADLDVTASILTADGWLSLEDDAGGAVHGYWLHQTSLSQQSQTHRNVTTSNSWVPGTFAVSSVPDNVQETLCVWVRGATAYEFRTRVQTLIDALDQPSFSVLYQIEDLEELWTCPVPADYQISTQQEFRVAKIGYVTATINRLPQVTLTQIPEPPTGGGPVLPPPPAFTDVLVLDVFLPGLPGVVLPANHRAADTFLPGFPAPGGKL